MTRADVAILGGGSAAEMAAEHLAAAGRRVVVVENRYVGGECPFLACVPSKALLHAAASGMSWQQAVEFRDRTTHHRDDSRHEKALRDKGVTVIRGRGVVTKPGVLRVDDQDIEWTDLVVATGGDPAIPSIDGIADVSYSTSDDALTATSQPGSMAILGGGPIGCELAQAFTRLGTEVTLLEVEDRLIPGEPEFVGETVTEALRLDGVEVLTDTTIERVTRGGDQVTLHFDDDQITTDRLLVAAGKRPRTADLGLETLGILVEPGRPLAVDDHGRLTDHVYAAGDVIGLAPYTHGANAQARTVAANILGVDQPFDLRAIPRCVFTDPAVMCVGTTAPGPGVRSAGFDVGRTARAAVDDRRVGRVEVFADAGTGMVVGAAVVAPDADAWGIELVLAVQARLPVATLAGVVHAFPTYGEALEPVYSTLLGELDGDR